MARKPKSSARTRKPSRPAKKALRKPAKKGSKKPAKRTDRNAPVPVKTGAGPTPGEIARAVVNHIQGGGQDQVIWDKFWSRNAVSMEGEGMPMAWNGIKAIRAKSQWWNDNHTIHNAKVSGPYVGAQGFAIHFEMESEEKSSGRRTWMEEVGVYSVQKGKVVREEFMYGKMKVLNPGRTASVMDQMSGVGANGQDRRELQGAGA